MIFVSLTSTINLKLLKIFHVVRWFTSYWGIIPMAMTRYPLWYNLSSTCFKGNKGAKFKGGGGKILVQSFSVHDFRKRVNPPPVNFDHSLIDETIKGLRDRSLFMTGGRAGSNDFLQENLSRPTSRDGKLLRPTRHRASIFRRPLLV